MEMASFPVIDMEATGQNIIRLRKARGLTVRDIQAFFGFEEPQAIYKWQRGKSLPTVDNLYALGALLEVPMEEILVSAKPKLNIAKLGQQAEACCPSPFLPALLNTAEVGKGVNHFSALFVQAEHKVRGFAPEAGIDIRKSKHRYIIIVRIG